MLRCLSREWQPKVATITESRDLSNMTLATLFGKEHEMELLRLNQHEENDKILKEKGKEAMKILQKKPNQMMNFQKNGKPQKIIPLTTLLVISQKG